MSELARLARPGDADAISALMVQARAEAKQKRGGELFLSSEMAEEVTVLTSTVLDQSEPEAAIAVVGLFDDVVLGVALLHVEERSWGRVGRLSIFYVEPEARQVAVGEAMMNLLQQQARDRGCSGLDAYALPGDRSTKNFFESFGLKARLLVVHTEL